MTFKRAATTYLEKPRNKRARVADGANVTSYQIPAFLNSKKALETIFDILPPNDPNKELSASFRSMVYERGKLGKVRWNTDLEGFTELLISFFDELEKLFDLVKIEGNCIGIRLYSYDHKNAHLTPNSRFHIDFLETATEETVQSIIDPSKKRLVGSVSNVIESGTECLVTDETVELVKFQSENGSDLLSRRAKEILKNNQGHTVMINKGNWGFVSYDMIHRGVCDQRKGTDDGKPPFRFFFHIEGMQINLAKRQLEAKQ